MAHPISEPCALLRPRTTLPLKETISKAQASLDFQSTLAIEYAQSWLVAAGSLKVPLSGIVRRALAVYVQHLAADTTDPQAERMSVRLTCAPIHWDAEAQSAALERLRTAHLGKPLAPFSEVLQGPRASLLRVAFEERHAALIAGLPT